MALQIDSNLRPMAQGQDAGRLSRRSPFSLDANVIYKLHFVMHEQLCLQG
jgi:hypothetical protein